MNFLVLTLGTPNYRDVADISHVNKAAYCERHGYIFEDVSSVVDATRSASWNKILLILERLDKGYDWIMWTDADSIIMDSEVRLEELVDESVYAIFTRDTNGVNCGTFLIRNCQASREFLTLVYEQNQFTHHNWWEQAAIQDILKSSNPLIHGIKVLDCRVMDAMHDTYQPGDFIIHFAGMGGPQRGALVERMKQYAALAV